MTADGVTAIDGLTHFIVEYSEQDGRWRSNRTAQVMAEDVYRVMEIFRERHPGAAVHVVRRLSPTTRIYIDRSDGSS